MANRASRKIVCVTIDYLKLLSLSKNELKPLQGTDYLGTRPPDGVIAELQNRDLPQLICGKDECRVDGALAVTTQTKTFKNALHRCALLSCV